MLVALTLCALVFTAALYFQLDDASTAVKAMILLAMAAVTGLMVWVIATARSSEE